MYLAAAAAVVLGVTLVRLATALPNYAHLNFVSGTWIALARDLADGVFYRPVVSADGYGGVRYMPLYFVLHAAVMRLGAGPVWSGYVVTILSAAGMSAGVYVLLRRLAVSRWWAGACAAFWLASVSAQLAVTAIRGDLLPAALGVWGLAFCLPAARRSSHEIRVVPAAAFFVLAFSAKITAVWCFAAGFAALFLLGRRREAARLGAVTSAGIALAVVVLHLASGGRWLDSMRQCLAAGTGLGTILGGPVSLARMGLNKDPFSLMLWILALASLAAAPPGRFRRIETLGFLAAGVAAAAIAGSAGIDFNNLLDFNVMALVLFAANVQRGGARRAFPTAALALVVVCASAFAFVRFARKDRTPERDNIRAVLRAAGRSDRPLLSENVLPVIMENRRPFIIDAYGFMFLSQRRPSAAEDLLSRLASREFRAVVLLRDPQSEAGRRHYDRKHFCKGFAEALLENYHASATFGQWRVFLPNQPPRHRLQ